MNARTNCPNCGAPIDTRLRRCPYCETPYIEQNIIRYFADNAVYETEVYDPTDQSRSDFEGRMDLSPKQAAECAGMASRITSSFGIGINQIKDTFGAAFADIFGGNRHEDFCD